MKVQIIHLDPHEDYVSALDKLSWAKAPRILLVWPRRGRVLTRRLDLVLLQRNAQQRSSQIGLVTHDPDVRANAEALAIPVFDALDQIPEQGWFMRQRTRPELERQRDPTPAFLLTRLRETSNSHENQPLSKIIRLSLASLAFMAIIILAATLVPMAEITLTPETLIQELELNLTLDPAVESSQPDRHIPARWMSVQVEGSLRLPTSGTVAVPATYADGAVTFTNLTSEPMTLSTGTGLRASKSANLRYVTTEPVSLPGEKGAEISAAVQAALPGPTGNLPAAAIDAVEGSLGLRVTVTNPEPTSGGENETKAAVSQSDRSTLERELNEQLLVQATTKLAEELNPDEALVRDSVRLIQILDQYYDHQIGEPADSLSLNLILEVEGLIYQPTDIEMAAQIALESDLSLQTIPVPETLRIQILSEPEAENGDTGALRIIARQDTYESIDIDYLQSILRGRSPEEAILIMESVLDLTTMPQVNLTPTWFPRLPWLGMHIAFHYAWETE